MIFKNLILKVRLQPFFHGFYQVSNMLFNHFDIPI